MTRRFSPLRVAGAVTAIACFYSAAKMPGMRVRDGDPSDYGYVLPWFGDHASYVFLSYDVVFVASAIPLMCWLVVIGAKRLRSARRRRRGQCPNCGYDLRVQLALSEQSESNGRATPG